MLTGILAPSSGYVSLLGLDPWDPRQTLEIKRRTGVAPASHRRRTGVVPASCRRRAGVVPEDLALFDNLTAVEYLTFVGRMYLMEKTTIQQRSRELMDLLQLVDVEKKLTVEYSHGMKKKLALAAALLPNPDLLFLDEPFEGVDAVTSRVIRDLLAIYVKRGSTVFVTSHVLEIIQRICTHVGIIVKGQLVEQSSLEDLQRGSSLEQRFLEKVGTSEEASINLAWLEDGESNSGAANGDSAKSTVATEEPSEAS